MASHPAGAAPPKLSFAKVASSANPRSSPQVPVHFPLPSNTNPSIPSIPPIVSSLVPSAEPSDASPRPDLVHGSDDGTSQLSSVNAPPGLVAPGEGHTHISSSSGSVRRSSVDGKSVASGTTFAMDEKESLRPDDSASVKANEDEDLFSPPGSAPAGSRIGSDTGARAFRDQLREIAHMGPSSRPSAPASKGAPQDIPAQGDLLFAPPPSAGATTFPVLAQEASPGPLINFPPDEKLLEALNSPRDRLWVLKLEQDVTDFVKDSTEQAFDVPQCNSFYRMLAHRMADYYLLGHTVDNAVSSVRLYKTPHCRIPPRLTSLTNPSTAASTPPPPAPAMKILRRGGEGGGAPGEPGSNGSRHPGDADGDSGSDRDKSKDPLSREERVARYEATRLRILGSARPSEDTTPQSEIDESRSSSAAGKKKGKKQRSDSEDGFEARSAFNTYLSGGGPANAMTADRSTYNQFNNTTPAGYEPSAAYSAQQSYSNAYGPASAQTTSPYPWLQPVYSGYPQNGSENWSTAYQPGYNLPADFQQAMSFGQSPTQGPMSSGPHIASGSFHQGQNAWQQAPQAQGSYPASPNSFAQQAAAQFRPPSSTGQGNHGQPYQYGLLPNQMPVGGKRMGNPHHPLPGSFNRQQFNPQSQAFVPGHPSSPVGAGFGIPMMQHPGSGNYPSPGPPQRPIAYQPQNVFQSSPHPAHPEVSTLRGGGQGLTHPLPQPVFSPLIQLPQRQQTSAPRGPGLAVNNTAASSIAKWGAPSSLPAKPPPPANDSHLPRLPSFNAVPPTRLPPSGGSSFHPLPAAVSMQGPGAGHDMR